MTICGAPVEWTDPRTGRVRPGKCLRRAGACPTHGGYVAPAAAPKRAPSAVNPLVVPGAVVRVVKPAHEFEGITIPEERWTAVVVAPHVHEALWMVRDVDTGGVRPVKTEWLRVKRSATRARREREAVRA